MSQVELVGADGQPVGAASVEDAHQAPGLLHRAFSVFLRDESGRVLLQQRAAVKTRFPLRWGNTCCGHPGPGEPVTEAAARRLAEEVGVRGVPLTELGVYSYYAEDPATGRVEYEFDHVLVGEVPADLALNVDPDEVADVRWVSVKELQTTLAEEPRAYAPWLSGVTSVLASAARPDAHASSRPDAHASSRPDAHASPRSDADASFLSDAHASPRSDADASFLSDVHAERSGGG